MNDESLLSTQRHSATELPSENSSSGGTVALGDDSAADVSFHREDDETSALAAEVLPSWGLRKVLRMRLVQMAALAALLIFVLWRCLSLKFFVHDLDIWWHLRVGEWILAHRAFPHNGIFSWTAADRPWAAYSWAFEVLLAQCYSSLGLVGIGIFGTVLTLAVAFSVYIMTRRLCGRFWLACLLAGTTCSAFLFGIMPRPVFISMIFFSAVLTLILEANRTADIGKLYWLPLIFMLWANFHIQFVYGLFAVGLLLGTNLLQRIGRHFGYEPGWLLPPALPLAFLGLIFLGCVLATLVGPYSYHLYGVVYVYAKAKIPYVMIRELQPINFRTPSHYVQLLLTGAAFFALGRQKRLDLFKAALLTACTILAYRTMRDSWFICLPAAAFIADITRKQASQEDTRPIRAESVLEFAGLAVVLLFAGLLLAPRTGFNQNGLDAAISSQFPVKAVNWLRQNPQPGPLYNTHDWGGFLIWYMPYEQVAIDGRGDLYGDELDERAFKTQNGDESYLDDPYLSQAGVVIVPNKSPIAEVLSIDHRFQQIYSDNVAVVYGRRTDSASVPSLPGLNIH